MSALLQSRLPPGGLDEIHEIAWYPLVSLALTGSQEARPGLFPIEGVCVAPSCRGFMVTLGRPLAIAHDLESSPGVWWLVDREHDLQWIIWSDAHRRNCWKGGQLCVATLDASAPISLDHPGVVDLQKNFMNRWGPVPGDRTLNPLEWNLWFEQQGKKPRPSWPRQTAQDAIPRR